MNILVLVATALAAGVEWVEALTIVLAVGLFKGWRSAFLGMALAFVGLTLLVAAFGITITSRVSLRMTRTVVGVFLLLFGLSGSTRRSSDRVASIPPPRGEDL